MRHCRTRVLRWSATAGAAALLLLAPLPAAGQSAGLRTGLSVNPDQAFIGGHVQTGPLVERLHFRPNVEIGFGDNVTSTTLNFEFVWRFPRINDTNWRLYAGAGPAINIYSFRGRRDTEAGVNFLGGLEHVQGFFTEFKVGAADSPDFKLTVGYSFR